MFNTQAVQKTNEQEKEGLIMNESNKEYEKAFNAPETSSSVENSDQSNLNPDSLGEQNPASVIKDSDIHHMPDKFLKPKEEDKKKKNIFLILAITLLAIIVIVVGAFAFFVLNSKDNADNNVLDLEDDVILDNQVEEINSDNVNIGTKKGRDTKRIEDVLEIKTALSLYYKDIGKYPYYLSSLKKYLTEIPNNPEPGGEEYYYQIGDNADTYILTFILEEGTNLGNLILQEGKYELDPILGINIADEFESDPELEPELDPKPDLDLDPELESDPGLLPIPATGDDDDNDGLTNTEELLFATKFALPDSDFDGYLDGEELISLYDPLNDGAKLVENTDAVSVYTNELFNYSVLYPAQWLAEEKSVDFKETIFYDDENGDFFKIQVSDNPQDLTIQEWYSYFSPGSNVSDLEYFGSDNFVGVQTKDGFNIYIAVENQIYIISYILVNTEELNYFTTFKMFSNSFEIK
jgi:nitrate reductase NapE component